VTSHDFAIQLNMGSSVDSSQDLAKLEPLLVDQAGGVEWTKVPNAEQPLDTTGTSFTDKMKAEMREIDPGKFSILGFWSGVELRSSRLCSIFQLSHAVTPL
jgi:hypothetical protein